MEEHRWLQAADVPAGNPVHAAVGERQLWKFGPADKEVAVAGAPASRPTNMLAFEMDGKPASWERGVFLTPTRYSCSAEAREDLALTYGPAVRQAPKNIDRAKLVSLDGQSGMMTRTWPAFGSLGGGWETLYLDDAELGPAEPTCGSHGSNVNYSGYQSGTFLTRNLVDDFSSWVENKGPEGKVPWFEAKRAGRSSKERKPLELPENLQRVVRSERDDQALLRYDDGGATLSWQVGDWRWCVSAATWVNRIQPYPSGPGVSFWASAWKDVDDLRYIVGPLRPIEIKETPSLEDHPAQVWHRLSTLRWTLAKLLASPAPGIRVVHLPD